MPKFAFYCIVALFVLLVITSARPEEQEEKEEENKYEIKYDNIDIDELLKSERLLTNYIKCLMEEGPCTEDGRELKETLPDAIATDCSKCSEKQKVGSERVMHYMWDNLNFFNDRSIISWVFFSIDNRAEDWERLEEKYDPSGAYKIGYLQSNAKADSNDN